ncbi:MAG: mechanosensitive ion channel domain-containing protein [Longimicrobiales bacterium]
MTLPVSTLIRAVGLAAQADPPDVGILDWIPATLALVGVIVVLLVARHLLEKRRWFRLPTTGIQLVLLFLTVAGLIVVVMALPGRRAEILQVLGIGLGAAIAFASTTFIGNGLAGLMLRVMRPFAIGDWLEAGQHFGGVLESGLFHVKIQTVDLDLTTLPNLYLASHPFTVIPARESRGPNGKARKPGTRVSAEVSLGYDIEHTRVDQLLSQAAQNAGLQDPRVHVLELGDFSVTYRVQGATEAIDALISVRSSLREHMLDTLHAADIEIASPTLMTTRAFGKEQRFIARPTAPSRPSAPEEEGPDLPDAVEARNLDTRREELEKEIDDLAERIKDAEGEQKKRLEAALKHTEEALEDLLEP